MVDYLGLVFVSIFTGAIGLVGGSLLDPSIAAVGLLIGVATPYVYKGYHLLVDIADNNRKSKNYLEVIMNQMLEDDKDMYE